MIRNIGLKMGLASFLLLALLISLQPASALDASDAPAASGTAATAAEEAASGLQGIWKANLGESEVVMAINQSGDFLFGLVKSEGESPWNGAASGLLSTSTSPSSSSQSTAFLSMAALEGDTVTSTFIRADVQNKTMDGIFVRTDSSGKASRGEFTAIMISPDTSGYTPAAVATSAQPSEKSAAQEEAGGEAEAAQPGASIETAESRFKDVTKLAKGINPNILPRMAPL
ncbi:MAG TPA: hypothetical protein PLN19_08715 [Methanothrix sp.]|nr:hypothetical protein [Methanothrix sp.]HOV81841.1 hypothetical protein [Methanothrix sp.]HPC88964.1 hypothetical protein [Methanothrix sp.]HQE88336.1 hypothetical protein [Methanothrix sp.]HQI68542.1 hypothetical protein [Methanothrix sp.]